MPSKNENTTISSLDKAIDVLFELSQSDMTSIRELSDKLSISKSTLHRILQTLENKKMVIKDPNTEKYYLGYRILELSSNLMNKNVIRDYAMEHIKKLSEETGDTVQLAIVKDGEIIVVDTVEGHNPLRIFAQPGERYPLTYGNFGKIFLAFKYEKNISSYLNQIEDKDKFLENINQVKEDGFSLGIDTPIDGALSIAVPIFNSSNEIIAAISIVGVKTESKLEEIESLKQMIIKSGVEISKSLS